MVSDDLGVLGDLAIALGLFEGDGTPNPSWFESPDDSLTSMLANDVQRAALLSFVDEALGGTERTADASGVVWLPIVEADGLAVSVTIAETDAGIDIGIGIVARTTDPVSATSLSVPLFRAQRDGGPTVSTPLLLGSEDGRIRASTSITIDADAPVPGEARLGAIGLDVEIPTSADDSFEPVIGLSLTGLQLPGAATPQDIRVSADGADELDDAVLDLVLSLVRSTAESAAPGSLIRSVGGLLGLTTGDVVPDFPIADIATQGVAALSAWLRGLLTDAGARSDWVGHLATFLGGNASGDTISFQLDPTSDATLTVGIVVDTGPSGNARLTPRLAVELGTDAARVEMAADLVQVDLVTGSAVALPQLGVWAALGRPGARVLDVAGPPIAQADTLRVGFGLDAERRLTFVFALDRVTIGSRTYPVLDLTSPDAVMDAVGNTVEDIATQLLGHLGDALGVASSLLGLSPPPGVGAVSLADLVTDPLDAVATYWQEVVAAASADSAVKGILADLRDAVADAGSVVAAVKGSGTLIDPWRIDLIGPLQFHVWAVGDELAVGVAVATSVDTLGERCTVLETTFAATIATVDLTARTASLLPGCSASLLGRERGIDPPRVSLALPGGLGGISLQASGVGVRLGWSPSEGIAASIEAPNLRLITPEIELPITMPTIGADGLVDLNGAAWDGVQALVGSLGDIIGGTLGTVVEAFGWTTAELQAGGDEVSSVALRLADLATDPSAAIASWLASAALDDAGLRVLELVADMVGGVGPNRGLLEGTGHPDDPYRIDLGPGAPGVAAWFPPHGPDPKVVSAPGALQRWRPGMPPLPPDALEEALVAEAELDSGVRDLIEGRPIRAALAALLERWRGSDGRIGPPTSDPDGVEVVRAGVAVGQLAEDLDLRDLIDRSPSTTVYISLDAEAWPDISSSRRVDLATRHLSADMFTAPAAATGDWFLALGRRADCDASSDSDGTPEQAARLAVVLDALAAVSTDIVVVAAGGAGHAARLAAEAQTAVTDLITLGTPLSPISLTAVFSQPAAEGLRLLDRLLPEPKRREDEDLALGRALVQSLMELTSLSDPAADLRLPATLPPDPRAGLNVVAVFGDLDRKSIGRAMTAVVAAGLAERAQLRAMSAPPVDPTGMCAGIRLVLEPTPGAVTVSGDAVLTVLEYVPGTGVDRTPRLRLRLRLGDPLGWLVSTPDLDVRAVTADIEVPLDGASSGTARVVLLDARVFGQSWERLVLGHGGVPVLPEARVVLAAAMQRLHADAATASSAATTALLQAVGVLDNAGGMVADAVDQLVHDAGGLLRERLATHAAEIDAALSSLLGPLADAIDVDARTVHISAGDNGDAGDTVAGRFGWAADVSIAPAGVTGQVRLGKVAAVEPVGGLGIEIEIDSAGAVPLEASLQWYRAGGAVDEIEVWPSPDAAEIARTIAAAAPSLGGQLALELLRRADDGARPLVDAALDALGLLEGAIGTAEAAVRPLAGLLADPAGWLRSGASLAAEPARLQALFDALRPIVGLGGAPGSALTFAPGVSLSVSAAAGGARVGLSVDPTSWAAPAGADGRLSVGVTASLDINSTGSPAVAFGAHIGLADAPAGRQAVHVVLGGSGTQVFLRPTTGADVALVPFAGFGALAAGVEAALPFALDRLAEVPGDVGSVVALVGDALGLRTGMPLSFDGARLHDWATEPVAALVSAVPSIVATGLDAVAPVLDAILPTGVTVAGTTDQVSITIGDVALTWDATLGRLSISGDGLPAPGIDAVSFTIAVTASGLDEISATLGPARIDAGGVDLRPYVTVAAGANPSGGRRIAVGLAADDTHRFAARWLLDTNEFALVANVGEVSVAVDTTDAAEVALVIVDVIADLVVSIAMAEQAVQDLLDKPLGTGAGTVRTLLAGVLLDDPDTTKLIDGVFDLSTLLDRFQTLLSNLGGLGISIAVDAFTLSFLTVDGVIGVQAGLTERFALVEGDVSLWLENDDSWIVDNPPGDGGLFVGLVDTTPTLHFAPTLVVNGLGLRVGSLSGPLLDSFVTLDSIALHVYAEIDAEGVQGGGVQLQLSNVAVPAGGSGGENPIAAGIMSDTGSTPPQPAFSPSLAVQKKASSPVSVSLRAGDGDGPWWIAIQQGFGPLYLEQVGFGTEFASGQLTSISLLMDGSVSMFGLTCAVDDLSITYFVSNGDFFDAQNWAVDLAGLAVSADMAGVAISGGLLKQTSSQGVEYLGMLLGRFGVYGITIYGGYGENEENGVKFTSFFAVGAVNGPIGGPPAFFLTGIGGGFGINRELIVPTDLSDFGGYPLIEALDIAAEPDDPMTQLRELAVYFPAKNNTFWFAAGLSFTSFALVDGIAVVAVEVGDGLDINLLGLARMALPRPQVALVSIELALLVRFSSSEGVLWVQGQLTDNSWLLYPDIKLTGGFAYVIWFKGEHRGEFVLTLGGYHPDFFREGYPVVPRIGLSWKIGSSIVIEAGGYFALTSEALMAGGDFHAAATFGPAWADVRFGAHGIVYFDPFRYQINAYARISAGVTVDLWILGEVTISISIGARIDVTGPDFAGSATFEVGPIELTVAFGGSDKSTINYLSGSAFVDKYLDPADDGSGALAHTAMTAFGALPAKGEDSTPDGTAARPFVVVVEFGLTFTTTIPTTTLAIVSPAGIIEDQHPSSKVLGAAPMGPQTVDPKLTLMWLRGGVALAFPFETNVRDFGAFPAGVWGPPQDMDNRKVPKAEMIEALNELDLIAVAAPSGGGPEIAYHRVEISKNGRKPLPFSRSSADITKLKANSSALTGKVDAPTSVTEAFASAAAFLERTASPTSLAALRGERQAPPRLGTLGEGLDIDAITVIPDIGARPPGKVYDHFVDAPVTVGLLSGALIDIRSTTPARTTVKDSARAWRTAPPTMASVESSRSRSIAARLLVTDVPAVSTRGQGSSAAARRQGTVIGALDAPPTSVAHAPTAMVARSGASGSDELAGFTTGLVGQRVRPRMQADGSRRASAPTAGATLRPGQTVVLKLPNAGADVGSGDRPNLVVTGSAARVIVLSHGGGVLSDVRLDGGGRGNGASAPNDSVVIRRGAERIVAIGLGEPSENAHVAGLDGWHGGMQLPYVGWSSAIAPGCTVRTLGEPLAMHRERLDAGWIEGAELTRGRSTVTTRFAGPISTVVIVIDDPAAFGDPVEGRQLLLGLDGAVRATESGAERPPVVLAMENRSVLAYEIVPTGDGPVSVTIASELGWSLAGVMGADELTDEGAIALISARGLDAAVRPFAVGTEGVTRLKWDGATRTDRDRRLAKELASPRPALRLAATQRVAAAQQRAAKQQAAAKKPAKRKPAAKKPATKKPAAAKKPAKKKPASKRSAKSAGRKKD